MNVILTIVLAVQMLSALAMIGLILMQHGKGADAGAAFGGGGGGSASLFGASGSANFLSRSTAVLATLFLASTLALAYFGNLREAPVGGSVLESAPLPAGQEIPGAAPAAPAIAPAAPTGQQVPGN
jgi:preprotein translocase subunit SecG